jgi:hypothetical protein
MLVALDCLCHDEVGDGHIHIRLPKSASHFGLTPHSTTYHLFKLDCLTLNLRVVDSMLIVILTSIHQARRDLRA